MRDLENQMRELLRERSGDIGVDPRIPAPVIRRSRRRRALTVVAGALATAAIVVGGGEGIRAVAIDGPPGPGRPPAAEEGVPGTVGGSTREGGFGLGRRGAGGILAAVAGPGVGGRRGGGADLFTEEIA